MKVAGLVRFAVGGLWRQKSAPPSPSPGRTVATPAPATTPAPPAATGFETVDTLRRNRFVRK
jgi:hypothetical protein